MPLRMRKVGINCFQYMLQKIGQHSIHWLETIRAAEYRKMIGITVHRSSIPALAVVLFLAPQITNAESWSKDGRLSKQKETTLEESWLDTEGNSYEVGASSFILTLPEISGLRLTYGTQYLPFGSHALRRTSTLPAEKKLTRIRDEAFVLNWSLESGLRGSAYFFEKDLDESRWTPFRQAPLSFGTDIGYSKHVTNALLDINVGLTSDIGKNSLPRLWLGRAGNSWEDAPVIFSSFALDHDRLSVLGEWAVGYKDESCLKNLQFGSRCYGPQTWLLETGWKFQHYNRNTALILGLGGSHDVDDQARHRWVLGLATEILPDELKLRAELVHYRGSMRIHDEAVFNSFNLEIETMF